MKYTPQDHANYLKEQFMKGLPKTEESEIKASIEAKQSCQQVIDGLKKEIEHYKKVQRLI